MVGSFESLSTPPPPPSRPRLAFCISKATVRLASYLLAALKAEKCAWRKTSSTSTSSTIPSEAEHHLHDAALEEELEIPLSSTRGHSLQGYHTSLRVRWWTELIAGCVYFSSDFDHLWINPNSEIVRRNWVPVTCISGVIHLTLSSYEITLSVLEPST